MLDHSEEVDQERVPSTSDESHGGELVDGGIEIPVKLFIGRFPHSMSDAELGSVFEPFGQLKECTILRDYMTKESKGCAFIKFANLVNAITCIKKLNNIKVIDDSIGPLQVQFANGEIERLGLSVEQVESPPVKVFVGSLPPSFTCANLYEAFKPYGQVVETFILTNPDTGMSKGSGFVKMRTKDEAARAIAALNKLQIEDAEKQLEVRLAVSKLQREKKLILSTQPPQPIIQRQQRAPQIFPTLPKSGPTGCNVFVFHIPADWTEFHLRQYFANYGFLISATVIRDKITLVSKGYGFVSYDNPYSAQSAVLHMNGFMVNGKRLKVQPKRGEDDIRDDQRYVMVGGG